MLFLHFKTKYQTVDLNKDASAFWISDTLDKDVLPIIPLLSSGTLSLYVFFLKEFSQ